MARYAVVENGVVINLVEWDGNSTWSAPTDAVIVAARPDAVVDIGYRYADGNFLLST